MHTEADDTLQTIPTLTLIQPWATLVALGAKRLETRSWKPQRSFPVLAIHAAATFPRDCRDLCAAEPFRHLLAGAGYRGPQDLPLGRVLCLSAIHRYLSTSQALDQPTLGLYLAVGQERALGNYQPERWAWVLDKYPRPLERPIAARGLQRIWHWEVARHLLPSLVGLGAVGGAGSRP